MSPSSAGSRALSSGTTIDATRLERAKEILGDCVHYGFCVSVCPTYVVTRDENESPRGRIDLINEMLNTPGPPKPATVEHLDSCLSCLSCMSTCAAQVDYMHLIDAARGHIEDHYRRPLHQRAARALIAATIPRPKRMRLALRAARLARPIARFLPATLRAMIVLATDAAVRARARPETGDQPTEGERRRRVVLLPGCAQQVLDPGITDAAARLLRRHGCEVVVSSVECCGALTLHMGKDDLGRRTASRAVHEIAALHARKPVDAVVVTASGCGTTMKDYGRLLASEAGSDEAMVVGGLAKDITEVIADLKLEPAVRRTGLRVAYHDACSLQHGQKIKAVPRALLSSAGFTVMNVPEGHFCCGSAGTYNMLQPAMAALLGSRKAANIENTGADLVCMGNLGCIEQLRRYTSLPLVRTVELLDWATGGPLPRAMRQMEIALPESTPMAAAEVAAADVDEISLW